jgi:hypothetical protein
MRGGLLQRVHDAVEVILRIRLVVGIPFRLVAEHDAAVDDGGGLAIAAAEVEADPAPVQMPPQRLGDRPLRRQIARTHDLERAIEHPLADQVRVESTSGGVAVVRGQLGGGHRRPVDVDAPAAARPEKELDEPLEVGGVAR